MGSSSLPMLVLEVSATAFNHPFLFSQEVRNTTLFSTCQSRSQGIMLFQLWNMLEWFAQCIFPAIECTSNWVKCKFRDILMSLQPSEEDRLLNLIVWLMQKPPTMGSCSSQLLIILHCFSISVFISVLWTIKDSCTWCIIYYLPIDWVNWNVLFT